MNAKTILKFVVAPVLMLTAVTLVIIGCASNSSSSSASPRE